MNKTKIVFILMLICILFLLTGCTEVDNVNYDISTNADNFNVTRRIVVYNARTDKLIFELIGNFSLKNNDHNELEIICKVNDDNEYKKHFIYLNEYTLYTIEDVNGKYEKYYTKINYMPEKILEEDNG